ncbi:MAG: dTDP-4-amino-4,6-dideoxy-D-galactose acyltransferase [Clostridium butyricum]|nr:dTDP-4-amino-4,6-dideoxy-D-galactose acyltransferase [Clostridium butyricum]MDN5316937.1 dTDP-4-amino-4,6-dideoxy-D-galactose acyltransferase [Thermoanaerobacterium sp.]
MYKLEWDSKFWGIEIYNVDKDYTFYIPSAINEKKYKSWLIQALVDVDKVETINKLENEDFRYVDTKVNLVKKAINRYEIDEKFFKDVRQDEIENYKNIFGILYYEISRYKIFGIKKVNEFYYTWVINSIFGKMDDKCIGFYIQGKLGGFITFKIRSNQLMIGLIGVFPEFQRKGISQQLLNMVNNEALKNNCNIISVSTQGRNLNAINAYIKNGFNLKNIQNWYYLRGNYNDIF